VKKRRGEKEKKGKGGDVKSEGTKERWNDRTKRRKKTGLRTGVGVRGERIILKHTTNSKEIKSILKSYKAFDFENK